ncbi:14254_t:CDS:2, partial [Dentiscutata heterogama]
MDDYSRPEYPEETMILPFNISSLVQENSESQENLFEQLVNKHERNFGIKEINEEIFSKIESRCRINLPNVVILEPEPAPDSNASIFKLIDMYLKDLEQN